MEQLSELIDTQVVDASGQPVGSVDELVLNCSSGRIDRVIVKTPDRSRFSLDWEDFVIRGHQFIIRKGIRAQKKRLSPRRQKRTD